MKKFTLLFAFVLGAFVATAGSASACDMSEAEKIVLIDNIESIVQQIEFLNEEYEALKGAVSAEDWATFQAFQQQKKQALINLAIAKVQKI